MASGVGENGNGDATGCKGWLQGRKVMMVDEAIGLAWWRRRREFGGERKLKELYPP